MTSTVYLGSIPGEHSIVNEDLRQRGINLIRSSPSELNLFGTREYTHPSYEKYISHLPAALQAGVTSTAQSLPTGPDYRPYTETTRPAFMRSPLIIWNFPPGKTTADLDLVKSRFSAMETTSSGKPAFSAVLNTTQLRGLITDFGPNERTNPSMNNINIATFKIYLKLHAVFHGLAKLHQYALVADDQEYEMGWRQAFVIAQTALLASTGDPAYMYITRPENNNIALHMNLPTPFATHDYSVTAAADIPNHGGLLVPYVEELARDDHSTIPSIFASSLFGVLGENAATASAVYSELASSWALLKITSWGKELSHMYTGLRLAYETGAGYRATIGPQGEYSGFILSGGFFSINRDGVIFPSRSFADLQGAFTTASPHSQSLAAVYARINFADDMARQTALAAATSLYHVSLMIRTHGYNVNDLAAMKAQLIHVTFLHDRFLPVNASNIVRVLNAMQSGTGEERFPMHHLAVFETSQHRRLLSAFGSTAPSFRVDSGRVLPLTGEFAFQKKAKDKKTTQHVTTMYIMMKALSGAWADMEMTLATKDVLSAAGTPLASRASAKSIIRSYEAGQGIAILGALRSLAGVVMNAEASSSKKRGREDDDTDTTTQNKKRMLDF